MTDGTKGRTRSKGKVGASRRRRVPTEREQLLAAPGVKLLRTRKERDDYHVRTDLLRCTGKREGRPVRCYLVVDVRDGGQLFAHPAYLCMREALRHFENDYGLLPEQIEALLTKQRALG